MTEPRTRLVKLLAAFTAVYLIWGSTYLAIRFAIESFPPFSMAGTRFLIAGALLYGWARHQGAPAPTRVEWRTGLIVGAFLLLGGAGGVVWAQQTVPSGLTALLVSTEPLWVAVLLWFAGRRPGARALVGLLLGFGGVALLIGPARLGGEREVSLIGAAVLSVAALSWAIGSLYSRHAPQPRSHLMAAATSMLGGGALLMLVATATGEIARLDLAAVQRSSWIALGYLIVFGSLVGFSCYLWLIRATSPERASTYAFVNPVVALFLGWSMGAEALSPRTLLAAAVIVGAVSLIVSGKEPQVERRPLARGQGSGVRFQGEPT